MKNTGIMFVREIALSSRRTKGAFGPLVQAVSLKRYFCATTPVNMYLLGVKIDFCQKRLYIKLCQKLVSPKVEAIYQTVSKFS
jgi:hypothetical protein